MELASLLASPARRCSPSAARAGSEDDGSVRASAPAVGKQVTFELLLPDAPQQRARLPMRVNIFPHDTTDSIVTTVKNFYGLYRGRAVTLEDRDGTALLARYQNFVHQMTVYVRIVAAPPSPPPPSPSSPFDTPVRIDGPDEQRFDSGQPAARPAWRAARKRSRSPLLSVDAAAGTGGRRSASASLARSKARSLAKGSLTAVNSFDSLADANADHTAACSDSDAGSVSVSSSRKAKADLLVSAEISLDNIVEGGRRKRAKFESSVRPSSALPSPSSARLSSGRLTSRNRNYRCLCPRKCRSQIPPRQSRPSDGSAPATPSLPPPPPLPPLLLLRLLPPLPRPMLHTTLQHTTSIITTPAIISFIRSSRPIGCRRRCCRPERCRHRYQRRMVMAVETCCLCRMETWEQ